MKMHIKLTLASLMLSALPTGCGRDEAAETQTKSSDIGVSCPADASEAEALGEELLALTPGESLKDAAKRSGGDLMRLLACGWKSETVEEDGTRTQFWLFNWGEGRSDLLTVRDGIVEAVESH